MVLSATHQHESVIILCVYISPPSWGFPSGSVVKNPLANAGATVNSIPESGRSPGGGHGNPLQCSCLENSMDRGASVQSLSRVWLFATPWIAARQASLSITNCRSLPKLMCIESVMPFQPSHPLSPPSPPTPNPSQHQGLFQWVNSSHKVAKVFEFQPQHQSFQRTPRTDFL